MPIFRSNDTVASMSFAWKTADQTQSSNVALTDDTDLQIPVNSNATYLVEMQLLVNNAAAVGQFKFAFAAPAAAGFNGLHVSNVGAVTAFTEAVQRTDAAPGTTTALITAAIDGTVIVSGVLKTSATAGTLKLQWAQAVSDAGVTMVARGSWLRITRLGS